MSSQAAVHSIDAIKDFRVALALYGDETLAALGAVESEVRRTALWLHQDRPAYWQEQIKRRREEVSAAKSEVFRRKLAKTKDYAPSLTEPMENLRRAEAGLQDAEKRLALTRKWQPLFQQVVGEYHASTRRLKDLSSGEVPRGVALLERIIDALEAYLHVAPPSGLSPASGTTTAPAQFEAIAARTIDEEPPAEADSEASPTAGEAVDEPPGTTAPA